MANLKVTLELDSQGYIRNIKAADSTTKDFAQDAATAFNKVDQSMDQVNRRSANLSQGFGKLRSAIAGVAIGSFIANAMNGADAISDLSEATDISVGKLLEFEKALIAAGGRGDDAAKAITTFYASIQEANTGSDKTIEQFSKLGVSFNDLKTLSESDLLDKSLKGFKNLKDPVEKSTIAVDIFSKAFKTVNPGKLSDELDKVKGTLGEQERAAIATAEAIERFDKFVGNLKGAIILVLEPLLKFSGAMTGNVTSTEKLAETLKILVAGYIALKTAIAMNVIAQATLNGLQAAGMAKNPLAAGVAGLASMTAGVVALKGMMDLMKQVEDMPDPKPDPSTSTQARPNRAQEAAKQLAGQLNAVQSLADGYRRIAQTNQDRYTLEVELLGKTKEEQDIIKGTADINKRYAEQTAALEEKKKGAKGATIAEINKEIANLEDLRISELDIFNISKEQTGEYARQQQQVKNIVDLMEQMAQYQAEISQFQSQQDQARMAAFEQVRAQRESLDLLGQREQLEKSIVNLRGSDQDSIKKLFDLEQQRRTQLEAIQKIQNLPYEGVGGMKERMEEINKLYDQRREKIEANTAYTQAEQESFSEGWRQAGQKYRNNIKTDFEYAQQQAQNFTKGFEDAFVKFVQTGKLSFKDLANTMIAEFARIQAQKMLSGLFGGGGFLSSLFGFGGFMNSAGGMELAGSLGFANGGNPPVGKFSVVGERGPELFLPRTAGTIIPNHMLGGGGNVTNINYTIEAVDASSFRSLVARDPEFIYSVTEAGRRSQPTRRLA